MMMEYVGNNGCVIDCIVVVLVGKNINMFIFVVLDELGFFRKSYILCLNLLRLDGLLVFYVVGFMLICDVKLLFRVVKVFLWFLNLLYCF